MTKTPFPSAVLFYDATREALASFGRCELCVRQAERWDAAEIRKESASESKQRSTQHQEIGLQSLAISRGIVDDLEQEFEKHFAQAKVSPDAHEAVKRIREDIRTEVCDLEIKATDVTKIMGAVDQALDGLKSGSWKNVLAVCRNGIAQLEKARNSPDRGLSGNQPWWKVLGIVLIVGALAVVAIACLTYPPCAAGAAITGTIYGVWVGSAVVAAIGGILATWC
jgi:hypothetical protein